MICYTNFILRLALNNFRIFIEDTGVGINQADLKYLFLIDKSKSTKGTAGKTGTGYGLLLSKYFKKNSDQISVATKKEKEVALASFYH
ncbi:MAG: hypothetical protein GQ527_04005 [Bacteroidales bacterium]|nr:hypothetical protein [Bacteroidales bacterium]